MLQNTPLRKSGLDSLIERLRPRQTALQIGLEFVLVLALALILLRARGVAWAPLLGLAMLLPARVALESDLLPRPVAIPMLVWLAAMLMALAIGAQINPAPAWNRFWALAFGVVVFGAIWNMAQSARLRRWLPLGWLLVVLIAGLIGLAMVPANVTNKIPALTDLFARIAGNSQSVQNTFQSEDGVNPNVVAGLLTPALFLPFGLFMWLRAQRRAWRAPAMIGVGLIGVIMTLILALTQSRGAYLGFLAGVMALFAMRNRRAAWVALAVMMGGVAVFALALPMLDINAQTYSSGRIEIWTRALKMIGQFPLTGVGLNMFAPVSELLYKDMLGGKPSLFHAHNMLMQLWLDYGLFGLLAALGVMALVWREGARGLRRFAASQDTFSLWVLRALMAGQAAWFVYNLTDYANFGSKQGAIFWAAWGLILGITRLNVRTMPLDTVQTKPD